MATWRMADGWLIVPYSGPELTVVEIGVAGLWTPAYLDYDGGQRVAKVRRDVSPTGPVEVRARPPE